MGVLKGCWGSFGDAPQGFFRRIKNQGGGGDPSPKTPSPPPQTKVTIVGKNEIYNRENLVRPFLVHPPPCSKEALMHPVPFCLPQGDAFPVLHAYVCVAFLTNWSPRLQACDFADLMLLLQHLPSQELTQADLDMLISKAYVTIAAHLRCRCFVKACLGRGGGRPLLGRGSVPAARLRSRSVSMPTGFACTHQSALLLPYVGSRLLPLCASHTCAQAPPLKMPSRMDSNMPNGRNGAKSMARKTQRTTSFSSSLFFVAF